MTFRRSIMNQSQDLGASAASAFVRACVRWGSLGFLEVVPRKQYRRTDLIGALTAALLSAPSQPWRWSKRLC